LDRKTGIESYVNMPDSVQVSAPHRTDYMRPQRKQFYWLIRRQPIFDAMLTSCRMQMPEQGRGNRPVKEMMETIGDANYER
jgi:hypothetical protein